MRKLVVSMNVTLDGFMAGPNGQLDWHMPYWDDDMARATAAQLSNADTLLLGSNTYKAIAPYWQAQQANIYAARTDMDYADMMNRYQKVVFSKTLKTVSWRNSRLAGRGIYKEIMELKKSPGKELLVYGSGKLVAALNRLNLVDEYRLWVHPVVIKKGQPMFKTRLHLQPYQTKVFGNGVVLMCYELNTH